MAEDCVCHVAASFPHLGGYGIISATLRTGTDIVLTEGELLLLGPTVGDLSITAYAPLPGGDLLDCPGRANISFNWEQRIECDEETGVFRVYLIPRGKARASTEGSVTSDISMIEDFEYLTFDASAASGPHSVYMHTTHRDGHEFYYYGDPIQVIPDDAYNNKLIPFLTPILPATSKLYLTSFSWSYTPPDVPTVSYSFLFAYDEGRT